MRGRACGLGGGAGARGASPDGGSGDGDGKDVGGGEETGASGVRSGDDVDADTDCASPSGSACEGEGGGGDQTGPVDAARVTRSPGAGFRNATQGGDRHSHRGTDGKPPGRPPLLRWRWRFPAAAKSPAGSRASRTQSKGSIWSREGQHCSPCRKERECQCRRGCREDIIISWEVESRPFLFELFSALPAVCGPLPQPPAAMFPASLDGPHQLSFVPHLPRPPAEPRPPSDGPPSLGPRVPRLNLGAISQPPPQARALALESR